MMFSDFRLGQVVTFKRVFDQTDFDAFRALSGDANLLHAEGAFAEASEFGGPIVPLALAVAPFSAIAGMALPGLPSLILSQSTHACAPMPYGRPITYTAAIRHIMPEARTLQLDLRAYDGARRLIEGRMDVRARLDRWERPADTPAYFDVKTPARTAFVTGADGAIGTLCAARLERAGWSVTRHGRGRSRSGTVQADFRTAEGRAHLAAILGDLRPSLIVHCASAGIHDAMDALVDTNFAALKLMMQAVLPSMCAVQAGRIVHIGSIAEIDARPDMVDYAAAKAQAAWYLARVNRTFRLDGIAATTLMCDKVDTPFSSGLPAATGIALDPEEVAEHVVALAQAPIDTIADAYLLDSEGLRPRNPPRQSATRASRQENADASPPVVAPSALDGDDIDGRLRAILEHHLPQCKGVAEDDLTMSKISGWDSLKQIILALDVEKTFDVNLQTANISRLTSFAALKAEITAKARP